MWSSSSQRESLARYGDVVVFDLTYKTNSLKLPLAAFVGTDNHGKTVVFALALQLDETAPTMQWLFEQFKDLCSSSCSSLRTIFTDDDDAIALAVSRVFPSAIHRLCVWHLGQN